MIKSKSTLRTRKIFCQYNKINNNMETLLNAERLKSGAISAFSSVFLLPLLVGNEQKGNCVGLAGQMK